MEWQERPWGRWRILVHHTWPTGRVVKELLVKPGGMLSLQSHEFRKETWIAMSTGLIAYLDPRWSEQTVQLLRQDQLFTIEKNEKHRLINPTTRPISVIEVIDGEYDENDIERYQDAYDR